MQTEIISTALSMFIITVTVIVFNMLFFSCLFFISSTVFYSNENELWKAIRQFSEVCLKF